MKQVETQLGSTWITLVIITLSLFPLGSAGPLMKSKVIVCSTKLGKKRLNIKIGNEKIEEISEFCYLGSQITRYGRCDADIRFRIGQAKKAFTKILRLLVSNKDLEIRMKLLKIYVWSVALYDCEVWSIGKEERRRLEAF